MRDDGEEAVDYLNDGQNVDCSGWKRFLEMIVVRSHHRVLDQQVDGRRRWGSSGGRGGHVLCWLRIHDEKARFSSSTNEKTLNLQKFQCECSFQRDALIYLLRN